MLRWMVLAAIATLIYPVTDSSAQTAADSRERVNAGVVGVVAAKRTGTMTVLADNMAAVLNEEDGLRVLPILGRGSLGNIEDLLYLRGVDIALTQGDVLDFYREFNIEENVNNKIGYIAALGKEEAHILARKEILSVDDLAGKKVNFGWSGSGSFMSASIIFDNLGLAVVATDYLHEEAMLKLKSGEIDALFWMGGGPIDPFTELSESDGLHLLPVPNERISASTYAPAQLTSELYPNLIPAGQTVETVEVSTVMAAYKWPHDHPRRKAVELFTKSLYSNVDALREDPYHAKWRSMDLAAQVPGWDPIFPLVQLSSN